jgi:MoxR-like ATPase
MKLQEVIEDINGNLLERTDVVRGVILALLAKRHVFLLGPPGTAKSMTVDALQARVTGAERFKILMTRFTEPNEVIGPLDLKALNAGVYHRLTDGYLPTAHLAFLDECFKANSAILNSLLMMLNEREYRDGAKITQVPLMTCVGASNELPQGEDLGALYDRFLLRYFVPYLTEDSNFAAMLALTSVAPKVTVDLDEVKAAQRDVQTVKLSPDIIDLLVNLRSELASKGIVASDRRWREATHVLRAEAFLEGRSQVEQSDLTILANVFWNDPAERSKVAQAVVGFAVPELAKALELVEDAAEQHRYIMANTSTTQGKKSPESVEASQKFRLLREEFDALIRGKTVTGRMATIRDRFATMKRDIGKAILG